MTHLNNILGNSWSLLVVASMDMRSNLYTRGRLAEAGRRQSVAGSVKEA